MGAKPHQQQRRGFLYKGKNMNDAEKVWTFLRDIYGMDLTAATLVVLLKDGDTAVRFVTINIPQQEPKE
jgi:hypothetical protein